ncbi:Hsp70 family protein [Planococcus lenghuensis]|uniref:Chaperone protein DnaK n=1 Tax=Planococcus lenghuensis TaxID=2213202 RepID=A0A1Q2L172_9BACL|nr:Hsp70 family protein [Planococcus lenghuensis]AQQ54163.1 2-alkenal reductase [Planococcus lenghuensis]
MAIIGIDLGTTNSAIAYLKGEKPEIIPNIEGGRTTPSVFQMSPNNEMVIGQNAKSSMPGFPDRTITEVKRLMGSDETVMVAGQEYRPETVSAHILKYLKESAEEYLGEAITEAVITVPAYFSDSQRKATQKAGEIAGLKVERIINEPTAAAIAYGLENMDKNQHILVYDLGGGTFDVSVVEIFEGVVEVKASAGDNSLGGVDFDNTLADWIIQNFKQQEGIDLLDFGSAVEINQRRAKIKLEAENIKKNLSSQTNVNINIPFIAVYDNAPISVNLNITRDEFEDLIRKMAMKTLTEVDKALEDSNLNIDEINEVLLVGGSTRIPLIQKLVEEKFGKKAKKDINPDEAVALGAAVQAGIKSGQIDTTKGIMVIDVCPYTLGTEVVKNIGGQIVPGFFDPIIPRNSTIPVSEKKIYYTADDNQTSVDINVFQGDSQYADQNIFLSNVMLEGIPSAPMGQEPIEVKFSYDINGTLQVEATIVSTGKRASSVVKTKAGTMSEQEVKLAKSQVEKDYQQSELYKEVKSVITRGERMLKSAEGLEKEKLASLLQNIKFALEKNDRELVRKYEEELTDLLIELV